VFRADRGAAIIPAHCYQINLHRGLGGGEIYTRFFSEALLELGVGVTLFVRRGQRYWRALNLAGVRIIEVDSELQILRHLPTERCWLVTHAPLTDGLAQQFAARHQLTGFAHMPLYERNPAGFVHYDTIYAVSHHVLDSGRARGLVNMHPEPLYGVADLLPRGGFREAEVPIRARSVYDWDRRKLRDRLLGWLEPAVRPWLPAAEYSRRPGITLGIVSRLTPIKQFPLMFGILAPVLARLPGVNLEIFGSGGYASVRDLRASLSPATGRVRFWGHQTDVPRIYRQLDYVLSGLPEKEALGLNLIEAQYCDTPVLAVDAPPFSETVLDGKTGYLFADPRKDAGAGFGRLLQSLCAGQTRPHPLQATAHLGRFSRDAFRGRVRALMG